jgi:hypothetical protein
MQHINEDLLAGDLAHLVSHIFDIDSFKSKIGEDGEMVVLSFTVDDKLPADDLARFLEMGYEFVLDADATNGPMDNGKHKVFVEMKRDRHTPKHITELLDGVSRLTNIDNFKFRYYKSFKSIPATLEALEQAIPINANEYEDRINNNQMNNFSNFFNRGFIENVDVLGDDLRFQKIFAESIKMKIKDFGLKKEIHERIQGRLKIESKDISECIFLTKYLGDYNITKIDNSFIFENNGYAVVLERI